MTTFCTRKPVSENIELFDVEQLISRYPVDLADNFSLRPSLFRNKNLSKHLSRYLFNLINLNNMNTTLEAIFESFQASTTSKDLTFNNQLTFAGKHILNSLSDFLNRRNSYTFWNIYSKFAHQLSSLIFMDVETAELLLLPFSGEGKRARDEFVKQSSRHFQREKMESKP